jgi:hypothetical protein
MTIHKIKPLIVYIPLGMYRSVEIIYLIFIYKICNRVQRYMKILIYQQTDKIFDLYINKYIFMKKY